MPGKVTLQEIAEQFDVWDGLVEDIELLQKDVSVNFQVKEFDDFVFVGAGSSCYLAQSAAATFKFTTGEATHAFSASEVLQFHKFLLKKERKHLVVLFTRSGETTETRAALDLLRSEYRVATIVITCNTQSDILGACDLAFPVKNCVEKSPVMTKSFTGMLFVSYMFASAYGERFTSMNYLQQLGEEGRASFEWQRRVCEQVCDQAPMDRVTLLGGGPLLGIARECGLKLDEVAQLRTRALPPLEFRHGYHTTAGPGDLVVMLMSDSGRANELDLLHEIKNYGSKIMVVSDKKEPAFDMIADYTILTGRGIPEHYRGILYAPFIQYLACLTAMPKGIDPDDPPRVNRVVRLG